MSRLARRALAVPRSLGLATFVLAAVVVSVLAVSTASPDAVPAFIPTGSQTIYRPTEPDAHVLIEPWLHTPWRGASSPLAGWLLGCAALGAAVSTAVAVGSTPLAAWVAALALAFSPAFAATLRHGGDAVLSILLVWVSWTLAWYAARRDRRAIVFSLTAWALAVTVSWLALITLPVVLLAWMHAARRGRARAVGLAVVLTFGTAGLIGYLVRMAGIATASAALAGTHLGVRDVWAMLADSGARAGDLRFATPAADAVLVAAAALALIALLWNDQARWWRLGCAASAAAAGFVWVVWPEWRADVLLWISWASTPLVAAALAWLVAMAPQPRRAAAVVAGGLVLIGGNVAATRGPAGDAGARVFAGEIGRSLDGLRSKSAPIALVAEDTLVDSALAAGSGLPRLSQRPEAVARAIEAGVTPIAGPNGRAHLEAAGYVFETLESFDAPVPFSLSRASARLRCTTTRGDRWSLLPGLEFTGRLGIEVPPGLGARLVLIVGDEFAPQLRAALATGERIVLDEQPLLRGPGTGTPPPDYWFDGGDPALAPPRVVRAAIPAHPLDARLISLYLGRRSPRVLARLEGYGEDARGRICAAPLGPDPLWGAGVPDRVRLPLDTAAFFGVGWYGLEGAGQDRFRWTSGHAAVLVPSQVNGPVTVRLDAAPASPARAAPAVSLRVNGLSEPSHPMTPGVASYEWRIQASRWRAGVNELCFTVSTTVRPADTGGGDTRTLGMRVLGVTLSRDF